mmetsp:Transcript_40385/g.121676  ORF Transcript_40385/g.121676 Transcript_40385/m.121676 type:complete len:117 (-) Transcript_40385:575-925(-)
MIRTERQTYFRTRFEPTRWCQKHNMRWLELKGRGGNVDNNGIVRILRLKRQTWVIFQGNCDSSPSTHWVLRGKKNPAMVDTTLEVSVVCSSNGKMPAHRNKKSIKLDRSRFAHYFY